MQNLLSPLPAFILHLPIPLASSTRNPVVLCLEFWPLDKVKHLLSTICLLHHTFFCGRVHIWFIKLITLSMYEFNDNKFNKLSNVENHCKKLYFFGRRILNAAIPYVVKLYYKTVQSYVILFISSHLDN